MSDIIDFIEVYYIINKDRFVGTMNARVRNKQDAEDIVQEAFTRAITYSEGYQKGYKKFGAWFYSILENCFHDHLDLQSKKKEIFPDIREGKIPKLEPVYEPATPEDIEGYEAIVKKIVKKRGKTKQILHLYFLEEYRPVDIEKRLDVDQRVVSQIVHRFKEELTA